MYNDSADLLRFAIQQSDRRARKSHASQRTMAKGLLPLGVGLIERICLELHPPTRPNIVAYIPADSTEVALLWASLSTDVALSSFMALETTNVHLVRSEEIVDLYLDRDALLKLVDVIQDHEMQAVIYGVSDGEQQEDIAGKQLFEFLSLFDPVLATITRGAIVRVGPLHIPKYSGETLADRNDFLRLDGLVMLGWTIHAANRTIIQDTVFQTDRVAKRYFEDVTETRQLDPLVPISKLANYNKALELAESRGAQTGAMMVMHRLGPLLAHAEDVRFFYNQAAEVVEAPEDYERTVADLASSLKLARHVRKLITHLAENPSGTVESVKQVVGRLTRVFEDCSTSKDRAMELQLRISNHPPVPEMGIITPHELVDELFRLQIDNALTVIRNESTKEKVLEVDVLDGIDHIYIGLINFGERIPSRLLEELRQGKIVHRGAGFGWGMFLSRQILRVVGGKLRIDSPVRGKVGTRIGLGFRKSYVRVQ